MKRSILALLLFSALGFAQANKNPCETLATINAMILQQHYKPKPIDDSLSVYVFKTFLKNLDEENRLFLEPEVDQLKKYQYTIDDNILSSNCSFLHEFYLAYNKTISRYNQLISEIENEPFAFSSDETVVFSKKPFPNVKEVSEIKRLYKKRILFNILRDIAELSPNKDSLLDQLPPLEKQYKAKAFEKARCKIESFQYTETEFQGLFINAYCSYFDPHTEYFSANEKASFFSSLSSDNMSFGVYMSLNDKEDMVVDDIIPASSAYETLKINKGDTLLKIKSGSSEYEMGCASLKKIDEIISSNDYQSAEFTFRKKSGEVYKVNLVKKILRDYQNNAYSFKVKTNQETYGYIRIPSFYSTFENGKSNVSSDVALEVAKLQTDKVDGIIIDLENNGGGSMEEAVRLSGLFLEGGPLAIMDNNKNKKEILKDTYKDAIYYGPMVIMINAFSASASEFFTNAMQDYNRAIIIGTKSLGKATMQRVFPINHTNDEFLKITLEKFYRVTGKSNQYAGITPNVTIPTLFDNQMPREDSMETALRNDELPSGTKFNRIESDAYARATALSAKRLETSTEAKYITNLNTKIAPFYDDSLPPIPLQFDCVFEDVTKINTLWKTIKAANEKEYPITITQTETDLENLEADDFITSYTNERMKEVKQNFHVLEAIHILADVNQKP